LIIYNKNEEPSKGFFLVTVDFGEYSEKFLRQDLIGERFVNGYL